MTMTKPKGTLLAGIAAVTVMAETATARPAPPPDIQIVGMSENWNIYRGKTPVGFLCGTSSKWVNHGESFPGRLVKFSIEATRGTATAKVYMRTDWYEGVPFYPGRAEITFANGVVIPVTTSTSYSLAIVTLPDPSRFYRELRLSPYLTFRWNPGDPEKHQLSVDLAGIANAMDAVERCMSDR